MIKINIIKNLLFFLLTVGFFFLLVFRKFKPCPNDNGTNKIDFTCKKRLFFFFNHGARN